jgi:hypothetical protein
MSNRGNRKSFCWKNPAGFSYRYRWEKGKSYDALPAIDIMVTQNAIPSRKHLGGYLPYAFTEHGILMLANVIKNNRAIKVSVRIIEIFVRMREMLITYKDVIHKLEEIEKKYTDHDQKIMLIFEYLKQFEKAKEDQLEYTNRPRIGFKPLKGK